jgi:hypothetical protein
MQCNITGKNKASWQAECEEISSPIKYIKVFIFQAIRPLLRCKRPQARRCESLSQLYVKQQITTN